MTPLSKRVRRACLTARGERRVLVVTLEPGDLVGVRPLGLRRTEYMPVEAIYHAAIKARVMAEKAAKAAKKKNR